MFHQEISSLKSAFKSNGYLKNFVDSCIKQFLDKLFVKNKMNLTVPKLQLVCALPDTGTSLHDESKGKCIKTLKSWQYLTNC